MPLGRLVPPARSSFLPQRSDTRRVARRSHAHIPARAGIFSNDKCGPCVLLSEPGGISHPRIGPLVLRTGLSRRAADGSRKGVRRPRVGDILKHLSPRPVTYEMYRTLSTQGEYSDGRGDALYATWLKMRSVPQ